MRIWEITAKRSVDHVIEPGGAGTLAKSFQAVGYGGQVSLIGVLSGFGEVNPLPVLIKSLRVEGIYLGSREMVETMNSAIAQAQLKPVNNRVFPFHGSTAWYHYFQAVGM